MKSCTLVRMIFGLAGLTAALLVAPASRAQADVAPDHFDGTDSWAAAAAAPAPAPKAKSTSATSTTSARSTKPATAQVQPVAARTAVNSRRTSDKKRKPSQRASN